MIEKFKQGVFSLLICISESVIEAVLLIFKKTFIFIGMFFNYLWDSTKKIRKKLIHILQYILIFLTSPFVKISCTVSKMKSDISCAKKENGLKGSIKAFAPYLFSFILGKHGIAVTLFNHAAPIISIIFLFNIITYATSINYAVKLIVNGSFIGYVDNEQIYYDAEQIVEQRLNTLGSSVQYETEPVFAIENAGYNELLSSYQIADLLLDNSDTSVDYAYGIFINGTMHGAVTDNTGIKKTLDSLLNLAKTGNPDEEVNFVWEIDYEQTGLYTTDSIIDPQIIIDDITDVKSEAQYYTVQYGDSQSLIGDILDMTQAEIEALNPGFIKNDLHVGDKIKYSAEVPALPVANTFTEIYEQNIPYETEYIDTDTLYEGSTNIKQPGENGLKSITARVSQVNGIESNRKITSDVTLSEPITEIVMRGTKPLPKNTVSSEVASYGKFIWPIKRSSGYLSEHGWWNGGYPGHAGIDFAAPYGTPIYAGASGTVVFAGNNYDYGNLVILQHDNGLRTYYAHCSSLEVSLYETVAQGQCIALVGETGRAYGCHVHFEVRKGNINLNPIDYIDR